MAKLEPTLTPQAAEASASATGKSRLLSIVATVGLVIIVGSCCLCSGTVYTQWPAFESDPEAASQLTDEILAISVPDVFIPQGTIRWDIWMFLSMRGAYYSLSIGDGELSVLEVDSRFIANAEFREHIIRSLREHGAGGGFDLAVKQSQTQTFDVAGEPVSFTILEAEDRTTATDRRLVDGIVDGKNGRPVMISLWVDEEHWDPELVETLIQSIGAE